METYTLSDYKINVMETIIKLFLKMNVMNIKGKTSFA